MMRYVIDGYNLLHAMGLLRGPVGPHGLEKARLALLGHLHGHYGQGGGAVTVVFDAAGAPPGAEAEQDYQGIHVYYALNGEADDLIEDLIQQDSAPRQLTVISSDHRIQQAARQRHCHILGCLDYLEQMQRERRQQAARPESSAKPEILSDAETQRWLQEFGSLEDDPKFRDLFGPPSADDA